MTSRALVFLVFALGVGACGRRDARAPASSTPSGTSETAGPPRAAHATITPSTPASAAPAVPSPTCTGAEDCLAKGKAAPPNGDEARTFFGKACDAGNVEGCVAQGRAYVADGGDPTKARPIFKKACADEPSAALDACAWFVRVSRDDPNADRPAVVDAAKTACSTRGAYGDNRALRAEACLALRDLLPKTDDDARLADRATKVACGLGNTDACDASREAAQKARATDDVGGATLRMGRMSVDGLVLSDIACRTTDNGLGGLFGGIAVGAGFKAKKAALDACSKSVVTTRVKWSGVGGKMKDITASGPDPKVNKCVERALAGAVSTTSGVCAATVEHGKK